MTPWIAIYYLLKAHCLHTRLRSGEADILFTLSSTRGYIDSVRNVLRRAKDCIHLLEEEIPDV